MTVLDLGNNVVVNQQFVPASRTASANATGVDTSGYAYALVIFNLGALDSSHTVTFGLESSITVSGTYTALSKLGTSDDADTSALLDTSDDSTVIVAVDLNNTQDFVRVAATHSGSNAMIYAVTIVLMPNYTGDATAPDFNV